jgi:hypothetical protein
MKSNLSAGWRSHHCSCLVRSLIFKPRKRHTYALDAAWTFAKSVAATDGEWYPAFVADHIYRDPIELTDLRSLCGAIRGS